ncbi:hypothetical protein EDB19DRAFT_284324 [Suillus lakei]|nr:hypothetical protein EDB19DRAFT_284324 [Suillus lakei]
MTSSIICLMSLMVDSVDTHTIRALLTQLRLMFSMNVYGQGDLGSLRRFFQGSSGTGLDQYCMWRQYRGFRSCALELLLKVHLGAGWRKVLQWGTLGG